jgi:hypothetical protein
VDEYFVKEYSLAVHTHPTLSGLLLARGQYKNSALLKQVKSSHTIIFITT